jgi:hypothetical protein
VRAGPPSLVLGKFRETLLASHPDARLEEVGSGATLGDRTPLLCVPLPALSPWARSLSASSSSGGGAAADAKRGKRGRSGDDDSATDGRPSAMLKVGEDGGARADRSSASALGDSFPLPDDAGLACLVHVSGSSVGPTPAHLAPRARPRCTTHARVAPHTRDRARVVAPA